MPTITVKSTHDVPVRYLRAECGVRYWEDGEVNGVSDDDGSRIPCRTGDDWCPVIDLETGIIRDWPAGTTADLHYKVCDDGSYVLLDESMQEVARINGYVPKIMCPADDGFGDYVIMKIDGDGKIDGWEVDLKPWEARLAKARAEGDPA